MKAEIKDWKIKKDPPKPLPPTLNGTLLIFKKKWMKIDENMIS